MARGDIEVYQESGRWYLRVQGIASAFRGFERRDEALAAGRREARLRPVDLLADEVRSSHDAQPAA